VLGRFRLPVGADEAAALEVDAVEDEPAFGLGLGADALDVDARALKPRVLASERGEAAQDEQVGL
jgi:hypothetical protein